MPSVNRIPVLLRMEFATIAANQIKKSGFNGQTPHLASGVAFTVLFSLFTIWNAIVCIMFHQWWFLGSWGVGLIFEIVGYSGRIWYTLNDTSRNAYIMELVCITVAPCFLMAGIYNILAQLVLVYGNKYSYLKPKRYTLIFIICDVFSIMVQAAGGGIASAESSSGKQTTTGSDVMIVGLAFQVATMTIFQLLWYSFLYKVIKERKQFGDANFNPYYGHIRSRKYLNHFFVAVSFTVILIYVRSIYRLIEISEGWSSKIATEEIYFNILEGLMVSLGALVMCIASPGLIYGKNAHLKIKNDSDSKNSISPTNSETFSEINSAIDLESKNKFDR